MKTLRALIFTVCSVVLWTSVAADIPVRVEPVSAPHGMVVAGHPQAAQIGVAVLRAGGNAVDAAVAISLALGVAEPQASGLGGKLMLLYYEAASGRTYALDAMDAAGGSLDVEAYKRRPEDDRYNGYASAAAPGLAAGLWLAHQQWGARPWAENVAPAVQLAREGFEVLPKTRDFFAEKEAVLRRGDAEIARLYLPDGALPVVGSRLANADLARTLELLAAQGRDGFYRGPVAAAMVAAAEKNGGGTFNLADLAAYEARLTEPIGIDFQGYHLLSSPPPTNGPPLFLTILKVLEADAWQGPLRSAANLDRIGRVWREVQPRVQAAIADVPEAVFNFEKLVAPDSIAELRRLTAKPAGAESKVAWFDASGWSESAAASTTHFAVADAQGNIVCATQSLSLHFGAGVVVPGTGIILNDSMSNFAYGRTPGVNQVAPGKRPRSTISPTLVFRDGRPFLAIGIPGSARIPTALLQVLLDRLVFNRPLAEAIGDTRFHYNRNWRRDNAESFEAESSLPESEVAALRAMGWEVELPEAAGTGKNFGGINAIELNADGSRTGYADPRRTNAAAGH
ncbi:MAG: gamma-glutamyltransferase [Opitutaceae bacterium]|nr:gamma-glutamyltransferase [Opitutaceae bacterium]